MPKTVCSKVRNDSGATVVESALLILLIALLGITSIQAAGVSISCVFSAPDQALQLSSAHFLRVGGGCPIYFNWNGSSQRQAM